MRVPFPSRVLGWMTFAAAIVLGCLHVWLTRKWIGENASFPLWPDEAHHLLNAQIAANALDRGWGEMWRTMQERRATNIYAYPPLVSAFAAILLRMGFSFAGVICTVQALSLLVIGLSTAYIVASFTAPTVQEQTGGMYRRSSLLLPCAAALITIALPGLTFVQRYLLLDGPLTAVVCFANAALIASRGFSRTIASMLYGAALAACVLVKWPSVLFLMGPCTYVLWRGLQRPEQRCQVLQNLMLSLACAVPAMWASGIYWFVRYIVRVALGLHEAALGFLPHDIGQSSHGGWFYYLLNLPWHAGAGLVAAVVSCALALVIQTRGRCSPNTVLLLLWGLVPLCALSALQNRWGRYLLPAMPVLGIGLVLMLQGLRLGNIVRVAVYLVALGSVCWSSLNILLPLDLEYGDKSAMWVVHADTREKELRQSFSKGLKAALQKLSGQQGQDIAIPVIDLAQGQFGNATSLLLARYAPSIDGRDFIQNLPEFGFSQTWFAQAPHALVYNTSDRVFPEAEDLLRIIDAENLGVVFGHSQTNLIAYATGIARYFRLLFEVSDRVQLGSSGVFANILRRKAPQLRSLARFASWSEFLPRELAPEVRFELEHQKVRSPILAILDGGRDPYYAIALTEFLSKEGIHNDVRRFSQRLQNENFLNEDLPQSHMLLEVREIGERSSTASLCEGLMRSGLREILRLGELDFLSICKRAERYVAIHFRVVRKWRLDDVGIAIDLLQRRNPEELRMYRQRQGVTEEVSTFLDEEAQANIRSTWDRFMRDTLQVDLAFEMKQQRVPSNTLVVVDAARDSLYSSAVAMYLDQQKMHENVYVFSQRLQDENFLKWDLPQSNVAVLLRDQFPSRLSTTRLCARPLSEGWAPLLHLDAFDLLAYCDRVVRTLERDFRVLHSWPLVPMGIIVEILQRRSDSEIKAQGRQTGGVATLQISRWRNFLEREVLGEFMARLKEQKTPSLLLPVIDGITPTRYTATASAWLEEQSGLNVAIMSERLSDDNDFIEQDIPSAQLAIRLADVGGGASKLDCSEDRSVDTSSGDKRALREQIAHCHAVERYVETHFRTVRRWELHDLKVEVSLLQRLSDEERRNSLPGASAIR